MSGFDYRIPLNSTAAETNASSVLDSAVSASAIPLSNPSQVNAGGGTYFVIAFFETDFVKPVNYTGNGSADGPLVYLDGQPEWWMVKPYDTANNWEIYDTARSPANVIDDFLYANSSDAEFTGFDRFDDLAAGIKARTINNAINGSGVGYIGVAFVNPLNPKGSAQARGLPN